MKYEAEQLMQARQEIVKLKAENARLAAALHFVADECDWEECGDGGDERIGPACWRTLDGSSSCLHDLLAPTLSCLKTIAQSNTGINAGLAHVELQRLRALCGEGKER